MVRIRQLADRMQHRLLALPILFVVGAILLSQLTLWLDRAITGDDLPQVMQTTVGSGRAVLSAMAGGLISSVTLLLSLMLVAVQLAGSQYSPRTLRDWIGDRTQQVAIGLVLGTAIYCLLILRETRTFEEGTALTPHLSVLSALVLAVASLVAVVRSVDHLTNSLRIGSVANSIMTQTVSLIRGDDRLNVIESPAMTPAPRPARDQKSDAEIPDGAVAITATSAGWVQQIDDDAMMAAAPDGSTIYIAVGLGFFTMPGAPIAWIWPDPQDEHRHEAIRSAIAVGDSRTLQEDIGFGILQMVDIALRALSPGVNDPNTANDIVVHIGAVMLALWERPFAPTDRSENGRTLMRIDLDHGEYLHAGFDQLRRYGSGDPEVAATIMKVLATLRSETLRRELPGPIEPIDEIIEQLLEAVAATDLSDFDKNFVFRLAPAAAV